MTINDVLAFVQKAMNEGLNFNYGSYYFEIFNSESDTILDVAYYGNGESCTVATSNGEIEFDIKSKDIAILNLLKEDIKDYMAAKAENDVREFLTVKEEKPTDINDLDSEDD